jgi:hypothetical protein
MHLSYHGTRYQSQANQLQTSDNNKEGNYRGNAYKIAKAIDAQAQKCSQLKYRGVNYKNCVG